jgi:outer membrane protein assembly factor BamB
MMRRIIAGVGLGATVLAGCSYIPWWHSSESKTGPLPEFKSTANARIAWQTALGGASSPGFAPARFGSNFYAASPAGNIVSIDAGNGQTNWTVNAGQPLSAGVGVEGRLVVAGTSKGDVLAFDVSGKPLWQVKVSSEIISPPQTAEGVVAVSAGDGRIFGLEASSGTRKWVWQQSTPSLLVRNYAGSLITRGGLFTGLPGGKLLALDLGTGVVGWQANIATPKGTTELERIADVTSLPAVEERQICAAAFQGRVGCFDLQRGTPNWSRELSSFAGIALDDRQLYMTDDKGNIHALDKVTGASVWKQDKLNTRSPGGPQLLGNYVTVVDIEGYVHLLDRQNGGLVGRVATDGTPAMSQPVRSGDAIAFISKAGTLYNVTVQ